MKRKILLICFALCLMFLLVSPVFAHPGRTDGNGGHTDHDTGEYHYHHGYSAHDHYDMDGDGDVDCPYDFDDKTNHSDHNHSTLPTIDFDFTPLPTVEPTSTSKAVTSRGNASDSHDALGALVTPVLILGLWFGLVYICRK